MRELSLFVVALTGACAVTRLAGAEGNITLIVDNASATDIDAINRAMDEALNKTSAALNKTREALSPDERVQVTESVE